MINEKTFFIKTYGCTSNKSDSEIMIALLEKNGYRRTKLNEARYLILNTCGVKQQTEEKIISALKKFSSLNSRIIIAGCLPRINIERIKKVIPSFSAIIDTRSIHRIVEVIKKIEEGKNNLIFFSDEPPIKPSMPKSLTNPIIGIIQISEGCNLGCSYCCTRFGRGRLYCYPKDEIIKEAKRLLSMGCKEIYLTSQDTGAYKYEDFTLVELINEISKIEGKFFVRVGMMNPVHAKRILDELVSSYQNKKIFKFLHLPLESGSDNILLKMKRGYKANDFISIVERFREKIPEITISTDVIVGFPGETEDDFSSTIKILEKIMPDIVNISKFGPRPGTEASRMKQLERKTINKRSSLLSEIVRKICLEKNEKWIGWEGNIIVDEKGKNQSWIGRNFAYKQVVINCNKNIFGKFVDVKIIGAAPTHLIGEIVKI
ncbi:MAG: tRNA (N(6)-L-threonylcarbamoyladenosine(37)-C(2))-methylthiotransferase [Candidatus Aenigmatarchaeota archaeon]